MTALNAKLALAAGNFQNITVTYYDTTTKYTFTTAENTTYSLTILANNTIKTYSIIVGRP